MYDGIKERDIMFEMIFDNSFWRSGYPIGIGILLVWWIVSKVGK